MYCFTGLGHKFRLEASKHLIQHTGPAGTNMFVERDYIIWPLYDKPFQNVKYFQFFLLSKSASDFSNVKSCKHILSILC